MSVKHLVSKKEIEVTLRMPCETFYDLAAIFAPGQHVGSLLDAEVERELVKHLEKLINDHKFGGD